MQPRTGFFAVGYLTYLLGRSLPIRSVGTVALIACIVALSALSPSLGGMYLTSPLMLLMGFVVFSSLVYGNNIINDVLQSRVMQYLGAISYSLYLWHVPTLAVVKWMTLFLPDSPLLKGLLLTTVTLTVSITIARISYVVIEQHLTNAIRDWLDGKRKSYAAQVEAV